MSRKILSDKTQLAKIGRYLFTKDKIFGIQPIPERNKYAEYQIYSTDLYVLDEYVIYMMESGSALANLIIAGIIVYEGKVDIRRGGLDIRYRIYRFYKQLSDERKYTEDGLPDYEDSTSVNENDCLKFGECLTFANQTLNKPLMERLLKTDKSPPVLQTVHTGKIFGESDKKNVTLLKDLRESETDNYAVPVSGQCYAIVRKKIAKNTPYHIAFVLHTHAGVNITLEAEADNGADYQPRFCLYDINPDGNTFHKNWSAELYKTSSEEDDRVRYDALYNNGMTIVLKSRRVVDIERELVSEGIIL
jgi:hypothetical protein